ncbi:MAG: NUDIX domain-containing protein [Thermoguttaceae bacterium]|nr:NUDIX domain-containing protein [Thermoguttaceae bacterium]
MTERLPTDGKKPLGEGAIIVVPSPNDLSVAARQRRYLVIRRSAAVIAPGKLCFPGGKCLPGETPNKTAEREFREEIGAEAVIAREIWQNVTPWGVHLVWFLASLRDPKQTFHLQKEEVAEAFWCDLKTLLADPDTLASNTEFLEGALRGTIDLEFPL